MTLAKPKQTVLNTVWSGLRTIAQFFWTAHCRVQARKQARLMARSQTVLVAAQPTAVASALTPSEQETLQVSEQVSYAMTGQPQTVLRDTQDIQATQDIQDTQDTGSFQNFQNFQNSQAPAIESTDETDSGSADGVTALLDEAHSKGLTTYPQLIDYVKQHRGTGCSRRVVSRWKKARGLIDAR
ncbi:hypothetical protein [Egbenema bharatensis]|uniref:hypothetical protein n=1 Tax=Egbenema bharatensis TaxID=3463334 RepID=UPI003A89006F